MGPKKFFSWVLWNFRHGLWSCGLAVFLGLYDTVQDQTRSNKRTVKNARHRTPVGRKGPDEMRRPETAKGDNMNVCGGQEKKSC
jgi:hypothetical protein